MIASLRRKGTAYTALAGMVTKTTLALQWPAWIYILQSLISMVVFVYFWRALYANTPVIAGMTLDATLVYILLVRIFQPLGALTMVHEFGYQLREGGIAHLLVRPLHIQLAYYVQGLGTLVVALARQLPVLLVALLVFRLPLPTDAAAWGVFILSALLGHSVLFCIDYILGCLAFYTTSAWGLGWAVGGVAVFFGGGLVPLNMLPDWLRQIVQVAPFAQAIYVPVSLLSGLTPLSETPRLLMIQLLWLAGLAPLARFVFAVAIRRITVQGG